MRDPAPSRIAYKVNRLLLRRGMKTFLRFGLPFLVLLAIGVFWASDPRRVEAARERVAEVKRQIEERPEFMVRLMAVENASPSVAADVREVLSLDFPVSSFDLDLPALRHAVESLDAVASASVLVQSGGVLSIDIVERVPVAVWRSAAGLRLVDMTGHPVVALAKRTERPELPLVVGRGADKAIAEALELFALSAPLSDRLRGFLRVGERRWDIVLDRDQRILLPEQGAVGAFRMALALNQKDELLDRDIAALDLRTPGRPVLRLGNSGIEGLFETDFSIAGDE